MPISSCSVNCSGAGGRGGGCGMTLMTASSVKKVSTESRSPEFQAALNSVAIRIPSSTLTELWLFCSIHQSLSPAQTSDATLPSSISCHRDDARSSPVAELRNLDCVIRHSSLRAVGRSYDREVVLVCSGMPD